MMRKEFLSNFIKIKRTPMIALHLAPPIVITTLFLLYYAFAGYRIIPDVRAFFILLQIGHPIFVGIAAAVFLQLDININGIQNTLGLIGSRMSVYMGKLLFLLFFSAINMLLYEVCFYVGVKCFLDMETMGFAFWLSILCIGLSADVFIYLLHMFITFRFGSSVSVLLGISGTILAGLLENPIGDKIWPVVPWEWGLRFLKHYFDGSSASVSAGAAGLIIMTLAALVLSMLWFGGWEGKKAQE